MPGLVGYAKEAEVLDEFFLTEIRAIEWFSRCGRDISVDIPIALSRVESWEEAGRINAAPWWEDAMLEARNRLTEFLHATNLVRYQRWNEIARTAKASCVLPLTAEVWRPLSLANGLSPMLEQSVQWNVLGAIMEHEYRDVPGRPIFFTHMLSLFRAGHFPCGWTDAEFPEGKLCVL
jgi:hypothetical protein